MTTLMHVSEGDLRKAITFLQSAHRVRGADQIIEADIAEIAGVSSAENVAENSC